MTNFSSHLTPDGFAVFLFHGVVREHRHPVRNYTRKHILLTEFEVLLKELCAAGRPVSLPRVLRAAEEGETLPPKAFAITFDDGFANNATLAAPLLEKMKIPAAFYVTTGFIQNNTGSWIDRIEQAVESLPSVALDLPACGIRGTFTTAEEKIGLLSAVRRTVKGDPGIDADLFADDLCARLGARDLAPDPDLDQKMTWDQVRALSENPLFTVGGHGHTHRILEFLDTPSLEEEITTSLNLLRAQIGAVEHYSYPEGLSHCYSDRVIDLLRRGGVRCSPTAEPGVNHVGDDPFRLKRVMVP